MSYFKWVRSAWFIFGVLLLAPLLGARASRLYSFTGKVTGLHENSVALSRGLETLEFDRSHLGKLKIGDAVTVWYSLDARKAELEPKQQPGQAAPGMDLRSVPHERKPHIINDDRIFYDARSQGDGGRPTS